MTIKLEYWHKLREELVPFIKQCQNGEITFNQYVEIETQIYKDFCDKYDNEKVLKRIEKELEQIQEYNNKTLKDMKWLKEYLIKGENKNV